MKILITGSAGFIGFHLASRLINLKKHKIVGLDNLNSYYDLDLKKKRLKILEEKDKNFLFIKVDLKNKKKLENIFQKFGFDIVVHLAAQAGVRYSINNPKTYVDSNLIGFFNILDLSKDHKVKHFLFASSSSVYGNNPNHPWDENSNSDSPLSFYAATKKSNELMAYAYNNIYKLNCTGLRFFTVYGEWGRPDMALYKFTNLMVTNQSIDLYNNGKNLRDFTNIHDVISSILKLLDKKSYKNSSYEIFNLGNNKPVPVLNIIKLLEKNLKIKAKINYVNAELGDANITFCNNSKLTKKIRYSFKKKLDIGVKEFVNWYLSYHKSNLKNKKLKIY